MIAKVRDDAERTDVSLKTENVEAFTVALPAGTVARSAHTLWVQVADEEPAHFDSKRVRTDRTPCRFTAKARNG